MKKLTDDQWFEIGLFFGFATSALTHFRETDPPIEFFFTMILFIKLMSNWYLLKK